MNDELVKDIKNRLYTNTGKISFKKINSINNKDLKDEIIDKTKFLCDSANFNERIYCILNSITLQPLCSITNTPLRFNNNTQTYNTKNKFTPKSVSNKSKNLFKETITIKNSKCISELNDTYINKKYNLLEYNELKDFILMFRSKYRNITPTLSKKYINEVCSIMHYTDSGFIKGDYSLNLFGERCYLIMNDMSQPPCCVDDPNLKAPYENYNIGYRKQSSNKKRIKLYSNIIKHDITNQGFNIINSDNIYNLKDCTFTIQCNNCKHISYKKLTNGRWKSIYCQGCYGNKNRSKQEQEITDYIHSIADTRVEHNFKYTSSGKEIDIYLPDKNIGIEYNGVLWHSYGYTFPNNIDKLNNRYHLNDKRIECSGKGIRIINIFDTEWINKQNIVKSMLRSKLHLPCDKKIFARKCKVKILDAYSKAQFLNENHLQGNDNSSLFLGLEYDNEVVSIMTFGRRKITGNSSFELIRFCNKINTHVPGGASKLFTYFLKNHWSGETIVTYADLRYSEGNLYKQLNFKFKHDSTPNYFYLKDTNILESRVKYQKHKLKDKLEIFDETKTEMENMLHNNYRIIYDCGNKVYEYDKN